MVLQGGFAERLPDYAQLPWLVFVWMYSLSRIPVIFLDWMTIGFALNEQGITHRAGWPSRTLTRVRWSEVSALSVEQDTIHRLLRRYRVTISLGAQSLPAIVLEAVADADVRQWRSWFEHGRTTVNQEHERCSEPEQPTPERVSRVGLLDLAMISVTYGQPVLVVPFAVSSYYELADWVHLPGEGATLAWLAQSPGWTLLGALLLAAIYGWVRAWLRYGGHRVDRVGDSYEIGHRAVDRSTRHVRAAEVIGLRVDQNPLMRLLRMGALHLVLPGAQGTEQRVTILPVAPMSVVERHVQVFLPGEIPTVRQVRHGLSASIGLPLALAVAMLLLAGLPWPAGLTGIGALWLVNRTAAGISAGQGGRVTFMRGLWARRSYLLNAGALRSLSAWRFRGRSWLVAATLLDRSAVTLLAPGVSTDDRAGLREHVQLGWPVICRRATTRRPKPPARPCSGGEAWSVGGKRRS
ncbi:PH domain-containing protein [Tessaracoccus sp. OH4464_COT-324]|uniref:PH domain-containing protein n=1 Tax=Tessaracoccus sp. OH4464_COT-324 TaxID=2491059 RepID=UPI001319D2FD|nr:PH domain-containing protein [Tessaracoccus sp. OH4464_COT-324]